jgi:Ca2+-binding RTX toxin-like protein
MTIRLWGTEKIVNATTLNGQTAPVITALQNGGYVIAWVDDMGAATSVARFQRFDALGNKTGSETVVPSFDGEGDQDEVSIATLSNGNFVIVNRDNDPNAFSDGTINIYDPSGTLVGFTQAAISSAPAEHDFTVYATPTGFAISYVYKDDFSSLPYETYAQFYNNLGTHTQTLLLSDSATFLDKYSPAMAFNLSPLFGGVPAPVASTYLLSGLPQELQFRIGTTSIGGNTLGAIQVAIDSPTAVSSSNARIAANVLQPNSSASTAQYLVSYEIDRSAGGHFVEWSLRNAGGAEIKNGFLAGYDSELMGLNDGTFLVIYRGFDNGSEVHFRQIDNAGNYVGAPMVVNSNGNEDIRYPSITQLADGRLVVTWTDMSSNSDGSGSGINQQILDPREGIVNGHNIASVAETLVGNNAFADQIRGYAGIDTIYGFAGNDTIYGGDGGDILYDGRGDDTVYGGNDGDIIYGDLGDDEQFGEAGNDTIYSGVGSDFIDGGTGSGDSVFYVNEAVGAVINLTDQRLNAGSAFGDGIVNIERVYGSVFGANNLTGDNNSNILVGGIKADVLNGGGGFDILRGGLGFDTLTGGTSGDYFQYTTAAEGGDTITAWESGDKFTFTRAAFGNLAGANVAAANFRSVASGHAASTTSQKFIFDQATDQLWYDADGSGAGAAIFIADITTNFNILNTDLLLA